MTDEDQRIAVDAGIELTAATAAQIRSVVVDALQRGRVIDLNLESVVSYDAAGLGLLLGLKRRTEAADGHLVCVNPAPRLYSGIRKLGLHRARHSPRYAQSTTGHGPGVAHRGERRIVIFMTLLAPVVALALVLCMSALEDRYEHTDSDRTDASPR